MGCGTSKSTSVQDSAASMKPKKSANSHKKSSSIFSSSSNISVNINLDTDINVFDCGESSAAVSSSIENAKPRLARSGIRRGPGSSFGPVISGSVFEKGTESDVDFIDDHSEGFVSTHLQLMPDSGLGGTRANSEASDFHKTPFEDLSARLWDKSFSQTSARTDSVGTGSILTPNALNTSFRTCSENDNNRSLGFDTSLGTVTPYSEVADFNQSTFRNLDHNSSGRTSLENTPIVMHEQAFGAIIEESEGGFTPRSITHSDGIISDVPRATNKLLVREVVAHNRSVKWEEWSTHKGKVYDNNVVNSMFAPLIDEYVLQKEKEFETMKEEWKLRREEEKRMKSETKIREETQCEDSEDEEEIDSEAEFEEHLYEQNNDSDYWLMKRHKNMEKKTLRFVLGSDLPKHLIHDLLPACCVGELESPNSSRYLDDVRKDVKTVLNDLIRADSRDELTHYEAEYLQVLQRWISKYRDYLPCTNVHPVGNGASFPLPNDIRYNPECLRQWLEDWKNFDTEVPDEGSWPTIHTEKEDLGDEDEIFRESLRNHTDPVPFHFHIDGEAAWETISPDIFENDVMTEQQKAIEAARQKRVHLYDPERMKSRREKILKYFISKYEMNKCQVQHFLNWSDSMKRGEEEFQRLCET